MILLKDIDQIVKESFFSVWAFDENKNQVCIYDDYAYNENEDSYRHLLKNFSDEEVTEIITGNNILYITINTIVEKVK